MTSKIKILFLFLLLIINLTSLTAQTNHYSSYHIDKKYLSTFDNYFLTNKPGINTNTVKLDSLISTSVQGSGYKLIFQYNENAKISEWLTFFNDGLGWENDFNNKRYFDVDNNLICEIELGWSSNSNSWDSLTRLNYFYDEGKLFYSDFQFYEEDHWTNVNRYYYDFDQDGNLLLSLLIQNWSNNNWQYSDLISYYYTNKLDSVLFQYWGGTVWQNDKKTIFYYKEDEIDVDSLVAKGWTGSSWINYLKREILNDENHNQIEKIEKIWNYNSWQNSIRYFTTYNEFGLMIYGRCELWQNNQWLDGNAPIVFENSEDIRVAFETNKLFVYYSEIVEVQNEEILNPIGFSLSQNYPNPFNPTTSITYSIDKTTFVSLKVYDVLGNEITTLVNEVKEQGTYQIEFITSGINIPSGVYLYTLQAGNYSESKKMILLK